MGDYQANAIQLTQQIIAAHKAGQPSSSLLTRLLDLIVTGPLDYGAAEISRVDAMFASTEADRFSAVLTAPVSYPGVVFGVALVAHLVSDNKIMMDDGHTLNREFERWRDIVKPLVLATEPR